VKNCNERENGKRILGLMTDGKRECIFGKGVAKMYRCREAEKKETEETFQKVWMPITFVIGNYFGTPLCTTCKSNEAGDKDRSLRNRGRSW
jgi:hypothetical protein